ncbi:hypothetical protein [Clostridium baratii]|uniref:hypothetical protein n=1 Tax=Clostridium baratii TaxID=1561 RepID=UPI0030D464B1
MNKKKILEFIKKNKVSVGIVGAILSFSILTGVGFGIHKLTSSDNNSLAVAENEENKPNDTIQSDNATASLNEDENKKDEQATNESVENQNSSENDNRDTNSSNDSKSDNKETGSENTKKDDKKKNDNKTSSSDKKVSVDIKTEGGQGTSSNSVPNTQKPSNNHSHSWTPIKKTVHHKEQGHYENVLVKPAWTEKVPVYEEQERAICNGCGKDITNNITEHNRNHALNGEKGGWHTEWRNVQVGTKTVKHEAVYNKKWVVDKKAYDETIITGYKCSCGATK